MPHNSTVTWLYWVRPIWEWILGYWIPKRKRQGRVSVLSLPRLDVDMGGMTWP